ncbi:MAG: ankyrin repeat domain-containing protein [Flavobacteriaceae bacterium]
MNNINNAILKYDFELAKNLLKNGETWEGMQPYMYQQAYDRIINKEAFDLLDWFVENEHISLDIFEYDKFDYTIFGLFAKKELTENTANYLDKLLPKIENIEEEIMEKTWLSFAIENKSSIDFLQKLIDNGCDVHWKNNSNQNLLNYTQDIETSRFLLEQGLNINNQDAGGNTALFKAIEKRDIPLIELYLQNGAECNIQNIQNETPYQRVLFYAISPEIFDILNNYDPVRLDLKNKKNQTIFFEFSGYSQFSSQNEIKLLEKLLEQGADLFQVEKTIYDEETTAAKQLARKNYNALEWIANQEGFNPNLQDNKGNSWLHYVCSENLNFEQRKAQDLYKKVKLLLKVGANPEMLNDEDKSPIDYAQDDDLKAKALTLLLKQ